MKQRQKMYIRKFLFLFSVYGVLTKNKKRENKIIL